MLFLYFLNDFLDHLFLIEYLDLVFFASFVFFFSFSISYACKSSSYKSTSILGFIICSLSSKLDETFHTIILTWSFSTNLFFISPNLFMNLVKKYENDSFDFCLVSSKSLIVTSNLVLYLYCFRKAVHNSLQST